MPSVSVRERRLRNEMLEQTKFAKARSNSRMEFSKSCLLFYLGLVAANVVVSLFLLRVGPYASKPYKILREPSSVMTATEPSFEIFVHKVEQDMYISMELQRTGMWEDALRKRVRQVMRGFRSVVLLDVGSHVGFHSLAAASVGHQVIAVEPVAANVELLNKSIVANGMQSRIEVIQAAALDTSSQKTCVHSSAINMAHSFVRPEPAAPIFLEIPQRGSLWQQAAILLEQITGKSMPFALGGRTRGDHILDYHKTLHSMKDCQVVESVVLGDILGNRTDIMVAKIDVEGSELRALHGLSSLVLRSPPCYIFVEVCPAMMKLQGSSVHGLLEFADSMGYEVIVMDSGMAVNTSLFERFAQGGVATMGPKYRSWKEGLYPEQRIGDTTGAMLTVIVLPWLVVTLMT